MITVRFTYITGIKRGLFRNAKLSGTWNSWGDIPMQEIVGDDGCPAFELTLNFDDTMASQEVRWGVRLDGPPGANQWGIVTEDPDLAVIRPECHTILPPAGGQVAARYYLTLSRFLGAQKFYQGGAELLKFAVWAPNAQNVEVVFGSQDNGYIYDDGTGIDANRPVVPLKKVGGGDIWASDPLTDFQSHVGLPYMYRIQNAQGVRRMRTDIHSRWQIGRGDVNPKYNAWDGSPDTLDGGVSCSVVIDQDGVREEFEPTTNPPKQITDDEFWSKEFTAGLPVPTRLTELVIYELHIGSLGFGKTGPGNLQDAMDFIPHLVSLGVNAVELLPVSEFHGNVGWGYGDTHHFVIESSAGGRDKYKHFVRECHRNGIAVIQDVVYNHFDDKAERAESQYDSELPEENIYYWYEGRSTDYANPNNGYLQNGSSDRTPRLWEENVRKLFTSSAAEFAEEFHVDGFRVDLTQAIHFNHYHEIDGPWSQVNSARIFGQKLLREWSRTLNLIRPAAIRIAEDHSEWPKVTQPTDMEGMGFNAAWFATFYHDLIGDADNQQDKARVLHRAGFGTDDPIPLSQLSGSLAKTGDAKIAYHESHDEAGNSDGTRRTILVAVNGAYLAGPTRDAAEARARVVAGISVLSAGTPMFLMGEEIGAWEAFIHNEILPNREDILGERHSLGANLFRYYQDLIKLRRTSPGLRSRNIDIIHAADDNRVIAFTRTDGAAHELVVVSLNTRPFDTGYIIPSSADRLSPGQWREVFNSDSRFYGGSDLGNFGAALPSQDGRIEVRLPANALLVLSKM
ncbi:alpha-amylase family glycosyl hydrolase [Arthrobacter sp. ES3-54]|uniref:alpha-amylase family glycosyl hydrolase n=1 Tax=Arthrobacter sp. ES3-54 TaxID=1502991 RepID=UPI002405D57C|nr:alpha-amylase family glycosyl hydrolase [Arthrobacter sp. ES3-54]